MKRKGIEWAHSELLMNPKRIWKTLKSIMLFSPPEDWEDEWTDDGYIRNTELIFHP